MNDWVEWNGGECPVDKNTLVEYIMQGNDSNISKVPARNLEWSHDKFVIHPSAWVTSYRVVKEKPVEVSNKETNPKKQYGLKSIPVNLWPPLATAYGCVGLYNGKLSYGQGNYKATPVEASIYIAAAMRHLMAWADGQEDDPADGVPNLGGVLANIAILLESRANGTMIDDRQISSGYLEAIKMLREKVAHLQELHKEKTPRHYTQQDIT